MICHNSATTNIHEIRRMYFLNDVSKWRWWLIKQILDDIIPSFLRRILLRLHHASKHEAIASLHEQRGIQSIIIITSSLSIYLWSLTQSLLHFHVRISSDHQSNLHLSKSSGQVRLGASPPNKFPRRRIIFRHIWGGSPQSPSSVFRLRVETIPI